MEAGRRAGHIDAVGAAPLPRRRLAGLSRNVLEKGKPFLVVVE
jgi:hypothetical protein